MRPAAVIPMHDPDGVFFPHLKRITPLLKSVFDRVYISIPPDTRARLAGYAAWVDEEEFLRVVAVPAAAPVGDHFRMLYQAAAEIAPADQILNLCYIDRVAFALSGPFRDRFLLDMQSLDEDGVPLIFLRSPSAWETHPRNYYEIEQMATRAGEMVFGKTLDFGWCHLALPARDLRAALQQSHRHDLSMVAELVIALEPAIHTRAVDWLAWEDPLIMNCDAAGLKQSREASLVEVHKRLNYVIPILSLIDNAATSRFQQPGLDGSRPDGNHTNE